VKEKKIRQKGEIRRKKKKKKKKRKKQEKKNCICKYGLVV